MRIDLSGKTALITGASRGIGRAAAELFAESGCAVAINYEKDRASAETTVLACRKHGVRAEAFPANIADKKAIDTMVADIVRMFGQVDILVNNAGIWKHNPIAGLSEDRLRETIDINILGTFFPIMAVVEHMISRKTGTIINIASTAGQRGEAFHSPYGASKGAVISLTKSLAPELAAHNIRVNCVAPGWVETDMSRPALQGEEARKVFATIPMGRVGTPEELAGPIVFLASDYASFITGEILNVNGGAVLCG